MTGNCVLDYYVENIGFGLLSPNYRVRYIMTFCFIVRL